MIAWIAMKTGLSALIVKLILFAVASGAIFYAIRLWSNRVYEQGYQSGKIAATSEMETAKKAEWQAKETAIATDAANVATEKRSVAAAREQLAQDRTTIARALKDALAATSQRRDTYANIVTAVAPGDLDAAIRAISAELAAVR
jgi:hypothetical protein